MTGPIDVAYVEIKPQFRDFERELKVGVANALRDLSRNSDRTANSISHDFEKAGAAIDASMRAGTRDAERALENLGDKANREFAEIAAAAQIGGAAAGAGFGNNFTRDARGRLHDGRGRFVSEATIVGEEVGRAVSAGATAGLQGFAGLVSGAGSAISALGSEIGSNISPQLLFMTAGIGALVDVLIPLAAALSNLLGLVAVLPAGLSVIAAAIAPLIVGFQGFGAALHKSASAGGGATVSAQQLADAEWRLTQAQKAAKQAQEDITRAREDARRQLEDLRQALIGAALDERAADLSILEAEKRVRDARRSRNRLERQEAQLALDQARQNAEEIRIRNARLAKDAADAQKKGINGSDQVVAAMDRQKQAVHSVADAQAALKQAQSGGGGGGGVDAQAAALAALAPAARSVAKEFIALQPVFHRFQQAVQQALFAPLQGALTKFANTTLPHIQSGMEKVAGSFGKLFANILAGLSTPKAGQFFDKLFASTSRIIDKLGPGIMAILEAIADATIAALPFLEAFGDSFSTALSDFAAFIEGSIKDGSFKKFIEDGLETLKKIGGVVGALIDFFAELFSEDNADLGNDMLDIIKGIVNFLADCARGARTVRKVVREVFAAIRVAADPVIWALERIVGLVDRITGNSGGIGAVGTVARQIPGFASGGIAMRPMLATVAEKGPEAIIPLDDPRLSGGGGQSIVFGPGSIAVSFDGGAPTEQEARTAGAAVGRGILDVLAARNVRTQVRTV